MFPRAAGENFFFVTLLPPAGGENFFSLLPVTPQPLENLLFFVTLLPPEIPKSLINYSLTCVIARTVHT